MPRTPLTSTRYTRPLAPLSIAAAFATLTSLSSHAHAAFTWTGLGADANWSTATNWSATPPANSFNSSFTFDGSSNLTNNNDLTSGKINGLTFNPNAAPFTLTGNPISIGGTWTNLSPFTQTINLPVTLLSGNNLTLAGNASFTFTGDLTGPAPTTGASTITNLLSAGNLTLSNHFFLSKSSSVANTITIAGFGNTLISSPITNYNGPLNASVPDSGLIFTSTGTTTLTGQNNYNGNTTLSAGTVIFDFATNNPLTPSFAADAVFSVNNANLTFLPRASSATTSSINTFQINASSSFQPQFSCVTLAGSPASSFTLNINTLSSPTFVSEFNTTLFDISANPANAINVNHLSGATLQSGILLTNVIPLAELCAQTLVRDSQNIGFASIAGTSLIRIPDASLTPLTDSDPGNVTNNYLFKPSPGNGTISVGSGGNFSYNTLTIDTSNEAAVLNLGQNFIALGSNRGFLARGSHNLTINAPLTPNFRPSFFNYLSPGSALTINANLSSSSPLCIVGPGLTIYSGTSVPGANADGLAIVGGTFRFTSPVNLGTFSTIPGIMLSDNAILEIGAKLSTTTGEDLTLSTTGGLKLFGSAGLSAFGADRNVILNNGQTLGWGAANFLTNLDGTSDAYATFLLSSPTANATLNLANSLSLGSSSPAITRTINVANGSAPIDARFLAGLSGANNLNKTGPGTLELTQPATLTGNTTISAGTLRLAGAASLAATPNITIAAGATLDVSALPSNRTFTLAPNQTLRGNGSIIGPVTLSSTSTIAPGNSPGKLTFSGNLTMNSGTYAWQLATLSDDSNATPGTDFDQILIDASVANLTNSTVTLDFSLLDPANRPNQSSGFWSIPHTWTILSAIDNGSIIGIPTISPSSFTDGTFSFAPSIASPTSLQLTFTPAPEPASLFTLALLPLLLRKPLRK